jgi:hypothetical protein
VNYRTDTPVSIHHSTNNPKDIEREQTIKDPVHRSAPVRIIKANPYGKTNALIVRINPGAFSWNQGLLFVLRTVPQANAKRHPAENALKKTLSRRMLPLLRPARETNSVTSAGV